MPKGVFTRKPKPPRMAECHPERKHYAKGLCKLCYRQQDKQKAVTRKYNYKSHRAKQHAHKEARRKRLYGLGPGEYDRMYAAQGGLCAICEQAKSLVIDHKHGGEVRALLCNQCNRAIGLLSDNAEHCNRAAIYLDNYK